MKKILIIEDNKEIGMQIKRFLLKNQYEVDLVNSYFDALNKIDIKYDACLLDINLPDRDGHHLIDELKNKDIRIIITTVKSDENFIIDSLDNGADDYLIKPFSLAILRARIDAVLRTIQIKEDKKIKYGDIELNLSTSKVTYKKEVVDLTPLEYEMLLLFMKNPHRVYTRGQLLEMFWEDRDKFVNDNTLTATIKRLREKLDKSVITTVRGIGYRMDWDVIYILDNKSGISLLFFGKKKEK